MEKIDLTCPCLNVSDTVINEALDAASDMLALKAPHLAIGRCTEVVRPCGGDCVCGSACLDLCVCCTMAGIDLPGINPAVTSVKIDGVAASNTTYTLLGNRLVRFAADGTPVAWPGCQLLSLPSTAVGTFEITYTHGLPVDMLVKRVVNELTCALLKDYSGGRTKLPDGTTSASMNSVNVNVEAENMDQFPWLARFLNLYGLDAPQSSVYSPDLSDGFHLYVRS